MLLDWFACDAIGFTGVAGAAAPGVNVGDVVIGDRLIEHDLDASPIFPRYEVPLLRTAYFRAHRASHCAAAAAASVAPKVHRGVIALGCKFFASAAALAELKARLPDVLAVEMEGAAVAQVAFEHAPFAVARTISDTAYDAAPEDFARFVATKPGPYARAIVRGAYVADDSGRRHRRGFRAGVGGERDRGRRPRRRSL